jgi:hypothetical protein
MVKNPLLLHKINVKFPCGMSPECDPIRNKSVEVYTSCDQNREINTICLDETLQHILL